MFSMLDPACVQLGLSLAAATPTAAQGESIWELVLKGGWTMVPLSLCSLAALTIIVERTLMLRRARVAPPALIASVTSMRDDPARAAAHCAADPSPAAAVLGALCKSVNEPRTVRDRIVEEAGQRQVLRLRHRMRVLSALPQIATMLGLLGTVFGMIRTFTVIAASADSLGKTERLAQGIYEAWTATAAGLVVAIPTLLCYHLLLSRIDAASALLDKIASDWLDAESQPRAVVSTRAEHRTPEPAPNGVPVAV